jgi:putative toxin-antitoxin system antitoxin component (TIGR02293 family)
MTSKVASALPVSKPASLLDLWQQRVRDAAQGKTNALTVRELEKIWSPRFDADEIEQLVIPKRTLARRKAASSSLTEDEADRAFRLAQIQSEADRIFANTDKASRWLRTANKRLNGQTPLALLRTTAGTALVTEMLVQIDHGMFA